MGGIRDSSSDGGDEWDVERRAALQADRAAAEAAWGAHCAENDIGVLRWKAVHYCPSARHGCGTSLVLQLTSPLWSG